MPNSYSLNISRGCQHGCVFCYVHSHHYMTGKNLECPLIYEDADKVLKDELNHRRIKNITVHLSPNSDIFQPITNKLGITTEVLRVLNHYDCKVSIWTKGAPSGRAREEILDIINEKKENYFIQIDCANIRDKIIKIFECNAAKSNDRLKFGCSLIEMGVNVIGRLDPLIPFFHDSERNIKLTISAYKDHGFNEIIVSWLFLRAKIKSIMKRKLPEEIYTKVMSAYRFPNTEEFVLTRRKSDNKITKASKLISLPLMYRKEKFQKIREIAMNYDINCKFCACKNKNLIAKFGFKKIEFCHAITSERKNLEEFLHFDHY